MGVHVEQARQQRLAPAIDRLCHLPKIGSRGLDGRDASFEEIDVRRVAHRCRCSVEPAHIADHGHAAQGSRQLLLKSRQALALRLDLALQQGVEMRFLPLRQEPVAGPDLGEQGVLRVVAQPQVERIGAHAHQREQRHLNLLAAGRQRHLRQLFDAELAPGHRFGPQRGPLQERAHQLGAECRAELHRQVQRARRRCLFALVHRGGPACHTAGRVARKGLGDLTAEGRLAADPVAHRRALGVDAELFVHVGAAAVVAVGEPDPRATLRIGGQHQLARGLPLGQHAETLFGLRRG